MKKFFLFCSVLSVNVAFAQTTNFTNKRGFEMLPKAGDFSIAVDAVPILDFALNAVNIMNNTGQTAQLPNGINGLSVKYFWKDDVAFRGSFDISRERFKDNRYFDNPVDVFKNVATPGELVDTYTEVFNESLITLGIEKRRGYNRLQGYYGTDLVLGSFRESGSTEYGQAFNKDAFDAGYMALGDERELSYKERGFVFGLRTFVGIEYFVAPKISLGAEYGFLFLRESSPRGESEFESWDAVGGGEAKSIIETEKSNSYRDGLSTSDITGLNGQIKLNFYF
jgi:hypothetical protein